MTKLLERRTHLKLTQARVSDLSGVSEKTYAEHERGAGRKCPAPVRAAIAMALKCKPIDIFDEHGVAR